jgi:hypothetical protein
MTNNNIIKIDVRTLIEPDHNLMEDRTTEQLIEKYNQFYNMVESNLRDDSLKATKEVLVAREVIEEDHEGEIVV